MTTKPNIEVLTKSLKQGNPVFLSCNDIPITYQTKILHYDDIHLRLKNNVPPESIISFSKSSNYRLQTGMLELKSEKIESDGENIIFPIRELTSHFESRSNIRTYFKTEDDAHCLLLNPFDNQTLLKKRLIDISDGGFGLQTSFESKLFAPGVKFNNVKIFIDSNLFKTVDCEIVYKKKYFSIKQKIQLHIGCKFI